MEKHVYYFGAGNAEGQGRYAGTFRWQRGGPNLAEMTNLGIPVPPGFTISTESCHLYYQNNRTHSEDLRKQVHASLEKLEKEMGKKLGDADDPLLVSVRSGAAVSMPGMMDTVLNLGMNDKAVGGIERNTGNSRFCLGLLPALYTDVRQCCGRGGASPF